MRLVVLLVALSASVISLPQVWEKPIVPGLTYRMELDHSVPRVIHAFRLLPNSSVSLIPELANGVVYATDSSKGRETLTKALERTGALAGINADFFFAGDPLGLMVRQGDLLSEPYPNRAVFAWGGKTSFGVASFSGSASANGTSLTIDGVNRQCGSGQLVVFTPRTGTAIARLPNVWIVARVEVGAPGPNASIKAKVESLMTETEQLAVPDGCVALVASGSRASELATLRQGDELRIQWTTLGLDWTKHKNAIGGGPFLVRGSKAYVDAAEQGFTPSFASRRHPRTAIGTTPSGEIWLVAVDGRQTISGGATLMEMAQIMLQLGCTDAMNLDGGGSTTAGLMNQALNKPSEGDERPVSNMLLLVPTQPQPADPDELLIRGPLSVAPGDKVRLVVTDSLQTSVPNAEVVWWASGPAWIDQGGLLRVSGEGTVSVGAVVRGRQVRTFLVSSHLNATRNGTKPNIGG